MSSSFWLNVKLGLKELYRFNFDAIFGALSWRLPNWLFIYVRTIIVRTDEPKIITRKITGYFQKLATLDDLQLIQSIGISKKLSAERLEHGDKCYIIGQDNNGFIT